MQLRPVNIQIFNDPRSFDKFFYAMATLGNEEYPLRVLVQAFKLEEKQVKVQPTTCNTGKSVWIPADFLLEEVGGRLHIT